MNIKTDQRLADWEYCRDILPRVSRTFALNIARLDGDTYRAVLLGYLFFRIADTFEDNASQDEEQKIAALGEYADIFRGDKTLEDRLGRYGPLKSLWQEDSPDKELVENGDRVIACYFDLPATYRTIIDPHIARTAGGMASFQRRRLESGSTVYQLRDVAELEEYCYYVAGIVGEMLTSIFCLRETISPVGWQLEQRQVRFGLALQVTNIVKDFQRDIARGWCYIPASITGKFGIAVKDMTRLSLFQKRKILGELAPVILGYFDSTLEYIKLLPVKERPIRMFCIIPFVLAYNTLHHIIKMRGDKLTREKVSALLVKCESFAGSDDLLEKDFLAIRRKLA